MQIEEEFGQDCKNRYRGSFPDEIHLQSRLSLAKKSFIADFIDEEFISV